MRWIISEFIGHHNHNRLHTDFNLVINGGGDYSGLVSPMEFIPLAEETGLMNAIGDWVFKESVRQAQRLSQQLHYDCQISVNMSPVQFKV